MPYLRAAAAILGHLLVTRAFKAFIIVRSLVIFFIQACGNKNVEIKERGVRKVRGFSFHVINKSYVKFNTIYLTY